MTKLYSFLLAAAVATAFTAGAAPKQIPSQRHNLENAKILPLNTKIAKPEAASPFAAKAAKPKAETKDASAVSDVVGSYYSYYSYYSDSAEDWVDFITSLEITAGEGENEVILNGFWDSDVSVSGTYDADNGIISIPKQYAFTWYTDYDIYLVTYSLDDDENVTVLDDDLILYFDAEDGSIYSMDYWGMLAFYAGKDPIEENCIGFFDYCSWYIAVPTNGTDSYTVNNNTHTDNIACELDGTTLSLDNFYGYGMIVKFTIDATAKTATASSQSVIYTGSTDGIMLNADGESEVVGTISGDDNNIITIPAWNYTYSDKTYKVANTVITTPFNLLSAGVDGVTIDSQSAPVEYFNIKGIRVNTPANGLFIRRQGSTSSKVILK